MRLRITLARSGRGEGDDLFIETEPSATVGAVASAIARRDPRPSPGSPSNASLCVEGPGPRRTLPADSIVAEAAVRSGDVVTLVDAAESPTGHEPEIAPATLVGVDGPAKGERHPLRPGTNQVGRGTGNDIELRDPMVSKRHARLNISDRVEVVDLGSANGVYVNDQLMPRAILRPRDQVLLGDSLFVVEQHRIKGLGAVGPTIPFNRAPYLDPIYEGQTFKAPEPPPPPPPQHVPYIAMVAPLLMGVILYAVTHQILSIIFIGLSPLMMVGSYLSGRLASKADLKTAIAQYRAAVATLGSALDEALADEGAHRRREHPSCEEVIAAIDEGSVLLWTRRPDRHGFLDLRLGLGRMPSRNRVDMPTSNRTLPGLWEELAQVVEAHATVPDVPVVASLLHCGVVGVAGTRDDALDAARGLVTQVVGLHSPAEVVLAALLSVEAAPSWDWLKWLPHASSPQSPLAGDHLAVGAEGASALCAVLRDLVDERSGRRQGLETGRDTCVVVLVDDDVPVDRSLLVDLAERGMANGVHLIWVAPDLERLPARAEVFITRDPNTHAATAGFVEGGRAVVPVAAEAVDGVRALRCARSLAPTVDAGASADASGVLPARVSFVEALGPEIATGHEAFLERWRLSDSIPGATTSTRRRRVQPLHALVGQGPEAPLLIDLRSQGPHALVGGTTGAGKSEFLQSWVIGLAANHSPARVTFLFVDYKGGAAFSECTRLPHAVGLVTDLTPHLVRRALRSLNAELRHREGILNRKKAKDVLELEQRGDNDAPPSLVIVVDEFAALVQEVPEFVEGVVNIAQRGRSLGLHLVLATQHPAGVIRDNLRANTNLRIALRMADEADSEDVVGSDLAASFDPSIPGRGIAKLGPGRLVPFQAAYVGGWTSDQPPPPRIDIVELRSGTTVPWPDPDAPSATPELDAGPNDLQRLVQHASKAASTVQLDQPRRPWLPELAHVYDLARLPQSRSDEKLVYGVLDDPDHQDQRPVAFLPDQDGNMAIVGTGGSGKSATLRTIAVAAGLSLRSGPCHVYGLDFAARSLRMLEPLPQVGSIVAGDDEERVGRLLRTLRQLIDDRADRYARVRAGSVSEYRDLAAAPEEPRVVLLVDGFGSFRQEYEVGSRSQLFEMFQSIAVDGRPVGVHVVLTVDRAAIPAALAATVQRRLVLRLASDNDYALAGINAAAFEAGAPAGRGFLDGSEVQIAVLGGSASTANQAAAIQALADQMRTGLAQPPAPPIGRLPDRIDLDDLPALADGGPAVGWADETLAPIGIGLEDPLVVAGPPRSGKTTALITMVQAVRRARPGVRLAYVGVGRSALRHAAEWDIVLEPSSSFEDDLDLLRKQFEGAADGATVLVLDDAPRLASLPEDQRITDLLDAAVASGQIVFADGETGALSSSWGLLKQLKVGRHGLVLQPDQMDGDVLFKTPFPRTSRVDYPPGRAIYVRDGVARKIHVAVPETTP